MVAGRGRRVRLKLHALWAAMASQDFGESGGESTVVSDHAERITVHLRNCGIIGIVEAGRAHCYLCEDTARIGW